MEPPKGIEVNETPFSYWWIEPDGILCVKSKADAGIEDPASRHERIKNFEATSSGRKFCALVDARVARMDKLEKTYRAKVADTFNRTVKAMAIIADSPMSKMMVNLFFDMQKPTYPFRIFDSEREARHWLKENCR